MRTSEAFQVFEIRLRLYILPFCAVSLKVTLEYCKPNHSSLQTLIAIKAPSGTTLAVPYPDESVPPNRRKYQIFLKSKDGPVDIYLVNSPRVSSSR
jgi:hypothetical protein